MRPITALLLGMLAACQANTSSASQDDSKSVSKADASTDLDSLAVLVKENSAYRLVNRYPFQENVDSLKLRLPESLSMLEFHRLVQTLFGHLQDGHSNVRLPEGTSATVARGALPFVLNSADSAAIALAPCGCAALVAGYPRVVSINDVALDSLMRIAGIRFAGQSPQRFRLRALRALSQIESVLARAGANDSGNLTVRLRGNSGDTIVRLTTVPRLDVPAPNINVTTEVRDRIAVLRIPRMVGTEDVGYKSVRAAIESEAFQKSRALIVDVRDNDGGTRNILEYLLPRFIRKPIVYNVAVVRVDTNGVGDRGLVTPEDKSLPQAARATLRAAIDTFKPSWDYTADHFLPQRFASVIMPSAPSDYMGDRPVAVLMDEGSFSATDIFLGAMRLADNVTLMGVPSGGGSGRARDFVLPNSKLTVVISTMASFQPDGQLYDGIGVRPDVLVPRTIDGLAAGQDTQLDAALKYLRDRIAAAK